MFTAAPTGRSGCEAVVIFTRPVSVLAGKLAGKIGIRSCSSTAKTSIRTGGFRGGGDRNDHLSLLIVERRSGIAAVDVNLMKFSGPHRMPFHQSVSWSLDASAIRAMPAAVQMPELNVCRCQLVTSFCTFFTIPVEAGNNYGVPC